jgi:glycine/D-amino acid oxidase-like deaminating enzyme/nitrite reductase/ring-hydroxylating ferredoxin subunit
VSALGTLASLWLETSTRPQRAPLRGRDRVDVAVIGAGITGLTTALLLKRSGASVAVLEGRHVGAGATAYSTSKLSSLHGLTYARLLRSQGEEIARAYGEANEAGIRRVVELVEELAIDCNLRRKPNLTYTESSEERDKIEDEVEAALRLGLPASLVETADLPFPIAAAVRFEDQAEFHPARYLAALADAVDGAGCHVYEDSLVLAVADGSPCQVETVAGGSVEASHVVVATGLPFLDRALFFARAHPERSYVVASPLEEAPGEMYLSTEQPAHSIRAHDLDGEGWLLVAGEAHKTGKGDERERYEGLLRYARERFGVTDVRYRWATQDYMPLDGVPYVGRLDPFSKRIWTATGFRKWGLAMGTSAARLITDGIEGRDNPWAEAFDSNRLRPRASAGEFVKENADVAFHFFADRITRRGGANDLGPGEGRVVGAGLGQRAVHRDGDGKLHSLSARCSHLGCIVAWNAAESTWDCPCHGSRFSAEGSVIQGPAVRPLEERPEP